MEEIYTDLFNQFSEKWGFQSRSVGGFVFVLSNGILKLYKIVKDRRYCDGTKLREIFRTCDASQMFKYLSDNDTMSV